MKMIRKCLITVMILLGVVSLTIAEDKIQQTYSVYFMSVEQLSNATCYITAFDTYNSLEMSRKQELLNQIAKDRSHVVVVAYGINRELWKWNNTSKTAELIDIFRTNDNVSLLENLVGNQKINKLPIFFHIGGMQNLDTNGNINVYLNSRVGSYLLYKKLDLALSFTLMMNGNINSGNMINQTMIGVMSKYYYPIPKVNISPNIGLDLSLIGSGTTPTLAFLLGISWYIGPGSLDLGFRIRNGVTTMLGYTFMPF